MITKEKGYSLGVLVITIAIMIILASTAIVTMRNLTGDRDITNFMSDLREVSDYVKEYYSRKNTLPISYEDKEAITIELTEAMKAQTRENDRGNYYLIDLSKLGRVNLNDKNRGYFLNESSLNIYVKNPITYQKAEYYTLTDEILGIDKTYGNTDNFEVVITGNPITWVSSAKLLVSVPDHDDINSKWSFKYYKNGPITAEQFKTLGTFFEYGKTVEVNENGIHSFYVEDANGYAKVVNVVVTKIDDIKPFVYVTNEEKIVAGDDETGIRRVMYKIQDYTIGENYRAEMIDVYFQGTRSHLPDASGGTRWTYEEAYTGERIDDVTPSIGKSINTYKSEYEAYLAEYNRVIEDPSGDTVTLDDSYPQFQHNGIPYEDDETNIILYVEDYAGNRSVTDKNNYLCKVSRNMLLNSNFVETIIKPLSGARVIINNGEEYTKEDTIDITMRVQGAEYMYLTYNETDRPSISDYIPFETSISNYALPDKEGEITLYAFFTSKQYNESGELIYEKTEGKIMRDVSDPSTVAPEASIGNDLRLTVKSKQKDNISGIKKVEYGYKAKEASVYTWVDSLDNVILEESKVYEIKTRATDNAGNMIESDPCEVQAPIQASISIPNEPAMATGMTAIVWDGTLTRPEKEMAINPDTWENRSGEKVVWYSYHVGNNMTDTRDNIWANAKTSDGSYWVWIPRFAYRIIYYSDATKSTVKGYFQNSLATGFGYYKEDGSTKVSTAEEIRNVKSEYVSIDIIFLNGTSDTQYREENVTTKAIVVKNLPSEYIVHPAFQRREEESFNNAYGKWSAGVTGIWVAKFEASRRDATIDEVGVSGEVKVVPSVKSWTNITVVDAYSRSLSMYPSLSSHLMKNSEWGAVSYLAYSAYGRNGNEVSSNRSLEYLTGAGGRDAEYSTDNNYFLNNYAYNVKDTGSTRIGMYASTTGNIYGVYDMAGGVAEYVSTYLNNATSALGTSLASGDRELRELYSVSETEDAEGNNYQRGMINDGLYGSAMFETSKGGSGTTSLGGATSNYPAGEKPFIIRGGSAKSSSHSGIFHFDSANGKADETVGFRPVLAFR